MLGSCSPEDRAKWESNLSLWVDILGDGLQPALDACKNAWTGELLQRMCILIMLTA